MAIAKLLRFLDQRIRRELRELSDGELWAVGLEMNTRVRELASLDSPGRMPSMGARIRAWREYPFKKYLDEEGLRRYDERVAADPDFYLTPFDRMTNAELDRYIIWRRDQPPDTFDRLSVDDKYALWKRLGLKSLPVLPRSGSLPSNSNVRRRPDNRERSGPVGPAPKARPGKTPKAANGEAEEQIFRSLEDREIH